MHIGARVYWTVVEHIFFNSIVTRPAEEMVRYSWLSKTPFSSAHCGYSYFVFFLTEAGAYPQLPTQPNFFYPFQTHTGI